MKAHLFLALLFGASTVCLADTYSMDETQMTADVKVSVSGECKFRKTYKNAQIGFVRNETTSATAEGALTADNQLLLLYEGQILPLAEGKLTENLVSGKLSATERGTLVQSLSDAALLQLLETACPAHIYFTTFYSKRTIENKASYTIKRPDALAATTETLKHNAKGTLETWVIDPTKVINSDVTTDNIHTLFYKQKGVKTKIKISYRGQAAL